MAAIPVLIQLTETIRRLLRKMGRGLFTFAVAFSEAKQDWHDMKKKYPFAE